MEPGKHYKWIDPLSVAWVALITIIFIIPLYKIGLPGRRVRLALHELRSLWFAGFGLVFGWWALSAKNWFKGPVRMSEEEMLERERAYQTGEAGVSPAGAASGSPITPPSSSARSPAAYARQATSGASASPWSASLA